MECRGSQQFLVQRPSRDSRRTESTLLGRIPWDDWAVKMVGWAVGVFLPVRERADLLWRRTSSSIRPASLATHP